MAAALRSLDTSGMVTLVAVSSLYRTPPWGVADQPDFLNAVAALDTSLTARQLLDLCLSIEKDLKRERKVRWGPRLIDVDILVFGSEIIDEPGLQVPHPRMAKRAFVLLPLAEIAPDLMIDGRPASELAAAADASGIVRLPEGNAWWRGHS
jgi:2-amino-4-hydroxy-6-hydroxymethyldihydropteridine diphosphokinase